jgi:hypothetical protein
MAMKNLRTLLGDVHRYTALLGLTSDDVSMVVVFHDWARVSLHKHGMAKLVRRLKLQSTSKGVSVLPGVGEKGFDVRVNYRGIVWCFESTENNREQILRELFPQPSREKPRQRARTRRTTSQGWTWSSAFGGDKTKEPPKPEQSKAIPRNLSEAREFVRSIYRPTLSNDFELLKLAKRGQIAFHPDRPGGDAVLSRAFNAAASLLKGAM